MGKVIYGLKNVHYAVYDESTKKYGDWKSIPGAVQLTADFDSTQNDFYADDVVYATINASGKETGSIEFAAITDEMYADLFGYVADETSGLTYVTTDPSKVTVALGYEVSGNTCEQRGVRYNVKITAPSQGANTMSDSTDPDTVTCDFTAVGRDFTISGATKNVLKAHCDNSGETHASYDAFWTKVLVPGTAVA